MDRKASLLLRAILRYRKMTPAERRHLAHRVQGIEAKERLLLAAEATSPKPGARS